MADGILIPSLRFQPLDADGHPLTNGYLYSYVAGTSTPLSTYSDAGLTTANANPLQLDSSGRAVVFLGPYAYKFLVTDSTGATVFTQDNVQGANLTAASVCNGRLTGTSATPITDTGVFTTLYFTPYQGNRIALYNGAAWNVITFSEVSYALAGQAANTNFDVFAYNNAGTLTLETLAWTNSTTRATALTTQDGIYVKTGDTTRRYLGTYRTTGTIGQSKDSVDNRLLWNYYNRVTRPVYVTDGTDTWNYTTAAYQQANASAANQIGIVIGVAEVPVNLTVIGTASNTSANVLFAVAIGEDSVTTPVTNQIGRSTRTQVVNQTMLTTASMTRTPAAGYHYYAWLEYSAATGTTTWRGDGGDATILQNGISGTMQG